jgi:hypothetical protein
MVKKVIMVIQKAAVTKVIMVKKAAVTKATITTGVITVALTRLVPTTLTHTTLASCRNWTGNKYFKTPDTHRYCEIVNSFRNSSCMAL